MSDAKEGKRVQENGGSERAPYEAPAIIYEGLITTRANNTGVGGTGARGDRRSDDVDPASIFSSDS